MSHHRAPAGHHVEHESLGSGPEKLGIDQGSGQEQSRFRSSRDGSRGVTGGGTAGVSSGNARRRLSSIFLIVLAIYVPLNLLRQYLALRPCITRRTLRMSFNLHELEDLVWMIVYAGLSVWWTNGLTVGKRLLESGWSR